MWDRRCSQRLVSGKELTMDGMRPCDSWTTIATKTASKRDGVGRGACCSELDGGRPQGRRRETGIIIVDMHAYPDQGEK